MLFCFSDTEWLSCWVWYMVSFPRLPVPHIHDQLLFVFILWIHRSPPHNHNSPVLCLSFILKYSKCAYEQIRNLWLFVIWIHVHMWVTHWMQSDHVFLISHICLLSVRPQYNAPQHSGMIIFLTFPESTRLFIPSWIQTNRRWASKWTNWTDSDYQCMWKTSAIMKC